MRSLLKKVAKTHSLSGVALPTTAASILVVLEGAQGEALSGVSTSSLDYAALDRPQSIMFQDLDPNLGAVQGRALRRDLFELRRSHDPTGHFRGGASRSCCACFLGLVHLLRTAESGQHPIL